jgi:hypothetical protein
MGTQEPSDHVEAERQQTEWTGRWLCICQQAGISLDLPLRTKKARHRRVGRLFAALPPFGFRYRRAGSDPEPLVAKNGSGRSPIGHGKKKQPFEYRNQVSRLSGSYAARSGQWTSAPGQLQPFIMPNRG